MKLLSCVKGTVKISTKKSRPEGQLS